MNLLLTLDENYLLPCKVMLRSFFAANPTEKDVTVYLLHSAIPAGKLQELANFCQVVQLLAERWRQPTLSPTAS